MKSLLFLLPIVSLVACSGDPREEVPPLPEQNAETANQLMREAERAARNARARMDQAQQSMRSRPEPKEVTS